MVQIYIRMSTADRGDDGLEIRTHSTFFVVENRERNTLLEPDLTSRNTTCMKRDVGCCFRPKSPRVKTSSHIAMRRKDTVLSSRLTYRGVSFEPEDVQGRKEDGSPPSCIFADGVK